MYLWIFIGSYLLALLLIHIKISSDVNRAAARLAEMGMNSEKYRSMMAPSYPRAYLQFTLVTGTLIGCIAAALYWAFS